jgi:two-component system sensor histidine kinase HydH
VKTLLAKALGPDEAQFDVAEKRELLARLLGRLAHEIRNPLSSLDIHVQLLAEDLAGLPAQVRDSAAGRVEILRGEIHRLDGIIRQFIRLAGQSELDRQATDLRRILKHVHALLEPEAAQRNIRLRLDPPVPLPTLHADPGQLTQVFVNLVVNAIQAVGRDGAVDLRATVLAADACVSTAVEDTGPGISAGRLTAIFEPYFTTKESGTGLGLWIVQQIVSAHGGSVRAGNRPEGGARFEVRLPLPARQAE